MKFKTALTRSGNFLTPAVITVTEEYVKWEKRNSYLIGHDSKTIPIDKMEATNGHPIKIPNTRCSNTHTNG